MKRTLNIILGIGITLVAIVAILVMFAPTFSAAEHGSEFGNVFQTMFYGNMKKTSSTKPVPLMIVAFAFECAAVIGGIICACSRGKAAGIIFGLFTLLLLAAGIIFLFSVQLFLMVNPLNNPEVLKLGAGSICTAVFALIGGLLGAYGAYANLKAE